MANLYFTGDTSNTEYPLSDFNSRIEWLRKLPIISLDVETNVVDSILQRVLYAISISDERGEDVWVIEYDYLSKPQWNAIAKIIEYQTVIAHNASFDISMLNKYGCYPQKIFCTMITDQILSIGFSHEKGYHGLMMMLKRRCDIDISKGLQTSFGEDPFSTDQILYSAMDVVYLGEVRRQQLAEASADEQHQGKVGMSKAIWWENEYLKVVIDMESNGIRLAQDPWYAIEDSVRPIYEKELLELNLMLKEEFMDLCISEGWYTENYRISTPIWGSAKLKALFLEPLFPTLESFTKADMKIYLQDNDPGFPEELKGKTNTVAWKRNQYRAEYTDVYAILKMLVNQDAHNKESTYNNLNDFVVANFMEVLIENDLYIPPEHLSINWGSTNQSLVVFQTICKDIPNTKKSTLEDFIDKHMIIAHYLSWAATSYTLSNFGRPFYDKNVDLDGKHRARFNQVLKTGRISSVKPNVLNIPQDKLYRNCVVPDEGFTMIGADYDSMELVIAAVLGKEQSWITAFETGQDLHSINAHFMYKGRWEKAAEDDCAYFELDENGITKKNKCSCPKHKVQRTDGKTVTFGSIYGISFMGLAVQMKISEQEAKDLLKNFFLGIPAINTMLERAKNYATTHGRIYEAVFGRSRFFDAWRLQVNSEVSKAGRAAANYIIQASGASITKIAAVLFRRWIRTQGLEKDVYLLLTIHDELLGQAKPEYVVEAKKAMEYCMILASRLAGFDINASADHGSSWGAIH